MMDLFRREPLGSTTGTTTMINGKPSLFFLFLSLLFFCVSYDNDRANHTPTRQPSPNPLNIGAAMVATAAAGARDMTRLEPQVCF